MFMLVSTNYTTGFDEKPLSGTTLYHNYIAHLLCQISFENNVFEYNKNTDNN